jgi:hypothetical protein
MLSYAVGPGTSRHFHWLILDSLVLEMHYVGPLSEYNHLQSISATQRQEV